MNFGSFDSGDHGEDNGVGLVEMPRYYLQKPIDRLACYINIKDMRTATCPELPEDVSPTLDGQYICTVTVVSKICLVQTDKRVEKESDCANSQHLATLFLWVI